MKTLEAAGVLELGGSTLTKGARYRFIEDVRDAMRLGSGWDPVFFRPCGPEIPPAIGEIPDLHDITLYPDFHKNYVTKYEEMAQKLNIEGMMPFAPIVFDPIAIAAKLNLNIPAVKFGEYPSLLFNVPKLLLKLELTPKDLPSFVAKLPSIGIPPSPFPPQFPVPSIDLPDFPVVSLPDLLPDLLNFFVSLTLIPLKIPTLLTPSILLNLLTLKFSSLCTEVLKILPTPRGPNPILALAVYKVLAVKLTECIVLDVVGLTMGAASGGIVGSIGAELGYVPPPADESKTTPIRDKIVNFAKSADGLSYSKNREDYTITLFPDMTYKNDDSIGDIGTSLDRDENGNPGKAGKPKPIAISLAKTSSSCGIFARAVCLAAGASGDVYFDKEYQIGTAISGLLSVARKRKALVFDRIKGDKTVKSFKRGDLIFVGDESKKYPFHVEIALEDFNGDLSQKVEGIGGGALDEGNKSPDGSYYGSKISSTSYGFSIKSVDGYNKLTFTGPQNDLSSSQRPLLAIVDVEKLISNS